MSRGEPWRAVKRSTVVLGLLVMAACTATVIVIQMLRPSSSIQSAKAIVQVIPKYPGAYVLGYVDSDSPEGRSLRSEYRCSIECAEAVMMTNDGPDAVLRFYQAWFINNGWTWADKDVGLNWNLFSRSSRYFREYRFKGFDGPFLGVPWFEPVYEVEDDHHVTVRSGADGYPPHRQHGRTAIVIRVYRLQPLPSDTPRPALPTEVPTAHRPALPTPVLTHRPALPLPVPTPGR